MALFIHVFLKDYTLIVFSFNVPSYLTWIVLNLHCDSCELLRIQQTMMSLIMHEHHVCDTIIAISYCVGSVFSVNVSSTQASSGECISST